MTQTIVLIGAGSMGFAMLSGWLRQDPTLTLHVVEPFAELRQRAADLGARAVETLDRLPAGLRADLVVLAVKPQMVAPVLAQTGALAENGAGFVSVAAGITLGAMQKAMPVAAPVIRCMPNTPAAIGMGMMVLCAGPAVPDATRALADRLMATSGAVAWIQDEALMDAVTAISGSGPAYVFHFIEALAEAGAQLGLPRDVAGLLARQTVAGAAQMAARAEVSPGTLREQVTSPNGTTAAALTVLRDGGALQDLLIRATTAARDRGVELGR